MLPSAVDTADDWAREIERTYVLEVLSRRFGVAFAGSSMVLDDFDSVETRVVVWLPPPDDVVRTPDGTPYRFGRASL